MRGYAKVAPQFWFGYTGKRIRRLGVEAQLLAAYLISGQHANMIGLYYLPVPYIIADTPLTLEGAYKALENLRTVGFCAYDMDAEVVWVYEMAKYQVAESAECLKPKDKRCKGVRNEYLAVPDNAHLSDFFDKYAKVFHLEEKRAGRAFDGAQMSLISPFEPAPKLLRSQEQEQEQEQEQKAPPDGGSRLHGDPPAPAKAVVRPLTSRPDDFAKAWNELRGALLPMVREFTLSRHRKVKIRQAAGMTLDVFEDAVRKCASTPFLRGENDRGWKASFDWLIENDTNLVRVLEGKYDSGPGKAAPRSDVPIDAWSDEAVAARADQRQREDAESYVTWLAMGEKFRRENPWPDVPEGAYDLWLALSAEEREERPWIGAVPELALRE